MSRDELIAMAREADPFGDDGRLVSLAMLTPETLARFAALVAAREREACAQVCDELAKMAATPESAACWMRLDCAAAIRKRGAA